MVPLLAFIRMSISISHIKELNRVKSQQSSDKNKLKIYRGERHLAPASERESDEGEESEDKPERRPTDQESRSARSDTQ